MALYVENQEVQSEVKEEVVNAAPSVNTTFVAGESEAPAETTEAKEEVKQPSAKEESFLGKLSYVDPNLKIEDDGKTFINIGNKAATELGRLLSWTAEIKGMYTIYGKAGTLRNFSDAISIIGFPVEYMSRFRIPRDILEKHVFSASAKKAKIPNYWAVMAYVTAESIRARKELQQLMKNNTLDYACITETRKATVFGTEIVIPSVIKQMISYVGIVRGLEKIVKEDKLFDNAVVGKFIEDCKFHPELPITEGIQLQDITAK